jgi:hypothetical protein
MQHLFSPQERPLPEALQQDLEALLSRDNNSYLTWVDDPDVGSGLARWFAVEFSGEGGRYSLRLEFWIPAWMDERGVSAILPASRSVAACTAGVRAAVELDAGPFAELVRSLPRWSNTCARLINELWGVSQAEAVQLLALDYQAAVLPTPFPHRRDR